MKALETNYIVKKVKLTPVTREFRLFLLMLVYKFSVDYGFWAILTIKIPTFTLNFSMSKYIIGFLWCIVLFCGIDHVGHKASSFFLYLILNLQIIPITTIFALRDENFFYYNAICICFLLSELFVRCIKFDCKLQANKAVSQFVIGGMGLLAIFLMITIYIKNGFPSLVALNIYDVYILRSENALNIGKYAGYVLAWVSMFFVPFLLAKSIYRRKYGITIAVSIFQIVIYLYTGHKTYLFAVILCVICSIWAKSSDFYYSFYKTYSIGIAGLTVLAIFCPVLNKIWTEIYSLLIRRVLIVPANLKFVHYDYFSTHPKMGIYGAVPEALVFDVPEYYTHVSFPFEIGRLYFDSPNMSADTGAFAEGYMRFGYMGIFLIFLMCTLILKQIDKLQKRTCYTLAISLFVFPIYSLSENPLIKNIFFGYWLFWILILLFFKEKSGVKQRAQ